MFVDPLNTLYTVLSISVALLTVFLCVALIYLIMILRDASKAAEKVRDAAERINSFIIKPVALVSHIVDRIKPIIEAAMDKRAEYAERRRRRKV